MSIRPEIDSHKLIFHPERVTGWMEKGDCYPIHIEIGATNRCNQDCVFCGLDFVVNYKPVDIDSEVMVSALQDMGAHGVKSVMFGGEGEPLLHKDLPIFVKIAKEAGIDVALTTNGVSLTEEKREGILPYLSWVKFSIDSGTPKAYAEIHRTSERAFDKLMDNIAASVELKRTEGLEVTIGTQFLMIPRNMEGDEAVVLANRLRKIGVDYLAIKPYSHHPKSSNDFVVDPDRYNSLEEKLSGISDERFKVFFRRATLGRIDEGNAYPICYGLPFISLVSSRGEVLPCNLYYGDSDFSYGNLNEQTFSEVWGSEKRQEVLRRLAKMGVEECRSGCRCDVINRYLHRLRNPLAHDNFT